MRSKLKTSELLLKRDSVFDKQSVAIHERIEKDFIPALQRYFKTENNLNVETLCVNVLNNNFMIVFVSLEVNIGDSIQLGSGEVIKITQENVSNLNTPIQLMIPVSLLDETEEKILSTLDYIDSFVKSFSIEEYRSCVNEDKIACVEDLVKTQRILDKVEARKQKKNSVVEFDLDSLSDEQKRQIELFKRSRNTVN